jgi:hypothetical protein
MWQFTWFDELKMAEKSRSALTSTAHLKDNMIILGVLISGQGQGCGQFNNKVSGVIGKKHVKPCVYFNNYFSKKGEHDESNVCFCHF